jgi:hypothetical protein
MQIHITARSRPLRPLLHELLQEESPYERLLKIGSRHRRGLRAVAQHHFSCRTLLHPAAGPEGPSRRRIHDITARDTPPPIIYSSPIVLGIPSPHTQTVHHQARITSTLRRPFLRQPTSDRRRAPLVTSSHIAEYCSGRDLRTPNLSIAQSEDRILNCASDLRLDRHLWPPNCTPTLDREKKCSRGLKHASRRHFSKRAYDIRLFDT